MLNTWYAVYFIGSVTSLSHLRLFVHQSVCHNYLKGREVTLPISEFFFMTYTHKHTFTNTHRRGMREQKGYIEIDWHSDSLKGRNWMSLTFLGVLLEFMWRQKFNILWLKNRPASPHIYYRQSLSIGNHLTLYFFSRIILNSAFIILTPSLWNFASLYFH